MPMEVSRLGHVFKDKPYFAKDIVDDSFVPKDKKEMLRGDK